MTTTTNTFTMPSMYIPRAPISCNKTEIYSNTINEILGFDCVSKVTILPQTDHNTGFEFLSVFVNFKVWPRGINADHIYNDLINGTPVIFKYSDSDSQTNGYWKCFLARPRENKVNEKKQVVCKSEDEILNRV